MFLFNRHLPQHPFNFPLAKASEPTNHSIHLPKNPRMSHIEIQPQVNLPRRRLRPPTLHSTQFPWQRKAAIINHTFNALSTSLLPLSTLSYCTVSTQHIYIRDFYCSVDVGPRMYLPVVSPQLWCHGGSGIQLK